jgi:hypothetical protein
VGPLLLRWIFQGTWLAFLIGIAAMFVGVLALALILLAMVAWPIVIPGGCVLLGVWVLRRTRPRAAPRAAVAVADGLDVSGHADALPASARERIDRILQKARALADSAGSLEDRHLVQGTLDEYLPGAVEAYLSLPPGSAEWPVTPEGRTGLRLLEDQLDLLERNLDEIMGHAWQQGAQRLLAHERFLEQRFGAGLTEDLYIRH